MLSNRSTTYDLYKFHVSSKSERIRKSYIAFSNILDFTTIFRLVMRRP